MYLFPHENLGPEYFQMFGFKTIPQVESAFPTCTCYDLSIVPLLRNNTVARDPVLFFWTQGICGHLYPMSHINSPHVLLLISAGSELSEKLEISTRLRNGDLNFLYQKLTTIKYELVSKLAILDNKFIMFNLKGRTDALVLQAKFYCIVSEKNIFSYFIEFGLLSLSLFENLSKTMSYIVHKILAQYEREQLWTKSCTCIPRK